MSKKEIAAHFLKEVSSGKIKEAYSKFVHQDFNHHNPYFPKDRNSLIVGMEESQQKFPNKQFEVVLELEDGDFAAIFGKIRMSPDSQAIALSHFFKFKDGLIIDMWESSQEAPPNSPNKNGMF